MTAQRPSTVPAVGAEVRSQEDQALHEIRILHLIAFAQFVRIHKFVSKAIDFNCFLLAVARSDMGRGGILADELGAASDVGCHVRFVLRSAADS